MKTIVIEYWVEPILEIMKAIWGFTRVSARAISKVKGNRVFINVLNIKKNSDSEI